jgi:hypothetical protein
MLRVALGRAYVVSNDKSLLDDAVRELTRVTNQQRDHAGAQTFLARAYGALGQTANANLASAEAALAKGDFRPCPPVSPRAPSRASKRGSRAGCALRISCSFAAAADCSTTAFTQTSVANRSEAGQTAHRHSGIGRLKRSF